jgi:hypothetical protein
VSSSTVRSAFIAFLGTNAPTEKLVDLTGQYADLEDMLDEQSITPDEPWLGIQFVGGDEQPITIGSSNIKGKYRESGAVYIHIVDIAKLGVSGTLLSRAETLRDLFRGQKIGTTLVESVTPANFEAGATLRFEEGFMSCSFIVGYQYDLDL